MGFSLNIRIGAASVSAVTALWDEVSAFEEQPSMRALGYPPHLTLAIYDTDDVSEEARKNALAHAAAEEAELRLRFDRIGVFDGPPVVVWADPEPKEPLMRMHHAIHAVIDSSLCRPYYRPGAWVPHLTLGMAVPVERRDAAMAFAHNFRGVEAIFDVIDCVTFPPLRIALETQLPGRLDPLPAAP